MRCSYSLRGTAPESRCPECGLPVSVTAAGIARGLHGIVPALSTLTLFALAACLNAIPIALDCALEQSRIVRVPTWAFALCYTCRGTAPGLLLLAYRRLGMVGRTRPWAYAALGCWIARIASDVVWPLIGSRFVYPVLTVWGSWLWFSVLWLTVIESLTEAALLCWGWHIATMLLKKPWPGIVVPSYGTLLILLGIQCTTRPVFALRLPWITGWFAASGLVYVVVAWHIQHWVLVLAVTLCLVCAWLLVWIVRASQLRRSLQRMSEAGHP
jgi:hypothetical protein